MKDFNGNAIEAGQEVIFIHKRLWTSDVELRKGMVLYPHQSNKEQVYIECRDTYYKYNEVTSKHDIPEQDVYATAVLARDVIQNNL